MECCGVRTYGQFCPIARASDLPAADEDVAQDDDGPGSGAVGDLIECPAVLTIGRTSTQRRDRSHAADAATEETLLWLVDGALVVPDDAATEIGHVIGGRAGLDH
jgi:hypothetical protein